MSSIQSIQSFNPFVSVVSFAVKEFSSKEAQEFYVSKAIHDLDTVLSVVSVVMVVSQFFYNAGAVYGEVLFSAVEGAIAHSNSNPASSYVLVGFEPYGLLPSTKPRIKPKVKTSAVNPEVQLKLKLMQLTKANLRKTCLSKGIQFRSRDTKSVLADKLLSMS